MTKTWTIDAEGVLTIRPGFRRQKGRPDFYARDIDSLCWVPEGVEVVKE